MSKLLIIAYDFPPYVSVGGLRPASWGKYLPEFGIEPIVVTRQWENKYGNHLDYIAPSKTNETIIEKTEFSTIIRSAYKPNLANKIMLKYGDKKFRLLRKFISGYYEIFQWLFNIGTKSQLYFAAKEYLKNNKIDFIIATGEPFILFRYASILSRKFNIPWIADYRDPWSGTTSKRNNGFFTYLNLFNEKRFLKNVKAIITVSDFFKKKISEIIENKHFFIIINGYENEILETTKDIKQNSETLNIGFSGTIYPWHPIEGFLSVVNSFVKTLCSPSPQIQINFYGINIEAKINQLIDEKFSNLKGIVKIYPKLKNYDYVHEASKNNVFLLFNDAEFLGTKIFDYLAMKRLILLCFMNDTQSNELKTKYYPYQNNYKRQIYSKRLQAEVLEETNSGIAVENAEELLQIFEKLSTEFSNNGFITCNSVGIEKYSRRNRAKELAEILFEL